MDSLVQEARERKKKAIALASLPLSVAFFAWRLQDNSKAAPAPEAPKPSIRAQASPQVAKAVGPVLALERSKIVVVPIGKKDPFAPAFAVSTAPSAKPAPAAKTLVTELPARISLPSLGGLPMPTLRPFETVRPLPPTYGNAVPQVRPAVVPMPTSTPERPKMPYLLTGIVKGDPDVAILRHWDGSRRIVRVGDPLDTTYRLAAIEESYVQVAGDGDTTTLRLGGTLRPTAAPEDHK